MFAITLGALPSTDITLRTNSVQTFIVRVNALLMPSETTVRRAMQANIDKTGIAETLNVSRGLFSKDYDIAFKMSQNISFNAMSSIIKSSLIALGYDASVIDLKSELYEAPGLVSTVTAPITAATEAAKEIPGVLENVKWIALAGLGIVGLFYLAPLLRRGRP